MAQITVGGGATQGNAVADNPLICGGSDGTNARALLVDSSGRPLVTGGAADGSATAGNPLLIAGTDGSNARTVLVNSARQLYVNHEMVKACYMASFLNFTPAANATDFFAIFGSATKTLRILKAWLIGTANAAATVDIIVKLRTSANSSGTPTTLSMVQMDQNDAAGTAGPASSPFGPVTYAANPTLGSDGHNWECSKVFLPAASSSPTQPSMYVFDAARNFGKHVVLRGTGQGLVFNFNAQAVPTGMAVSGGVLWTEE